ncbi:leucine-rich repeat-containing protein 40 [Patella vulgata]|uniref:leucine-rich repeat-containing protein 40 n=1 Tax=Patella vulgata TaxID=6465 RepID=UPI0021802CDA|nr:leucine-rich repeat-containing protein 40 [Patella vulgata]XP_050407189.1 leucine-rich repeat-containing protein 40 [Patella vulgata]
MNTNSKMSAILERIRRPPKANFKEEYGGHLYFLHFKRYRSDCADYLVWGKNKRFDCGFCRSKKVSSGFCRWKKMSCGPHVICNPTIYRRCLSCSSYSCFLIRYEPVRWKIKDKINASNVLTLILNSVGMPKNLQKFKIASGGKIPIFPSVVGRFSNLSTLIVRRNQIEELPDCLSDLKNLTVLDLSDNSLRSIPQTLLFLRLERLILKNNRIEIISVDVLEMIYLVELNVKGNPLRAPNPSICSKGVDGIFKYLRQVSGMMPQIGAQSNAYVTVNTKKDVTEIIEFHPKIIAQNAYDCILSSRFFSETLQELFICGVKCPVIPLSISRCVNLKMVDFHDNYIVTIPIEIVHLQKLEILNLSNNSITTIPPYVGFLRSLKRLNLASNNMTQLPLSFLNLTQLEDLDLSGNNMTSPSMDICSGGISAILTELRRLRVPRANTFAVATPYLEEYEESLKTLCVHTLLKYKTSLELDLASPFLKRHITQEVDKRGPVKIMSCNICRKLFSSELNFIMHDCHTDFDMDYVLTVLNSNSYFRNS